MRKKYYSLLFIFLLMFTTISPAFSSGTVSAEDKKVYADGEYQLPFQVLKDKTTETSVADGYFEKPGNLFVENGKYYVEATLKNHSWWQEFQVQSGNDFVDVQTISIDEVEDKRVVKFAVENPDELLNAKVHIVIQGIPGMPNFQYDNRYDIQIQFDTSGIPEASEEDENGEEELPVDPQEPLEKEDLEQPEQPEDPEQPEPGENNEQPENPAGAKAIYLADGDYTIEFQTLHAEEDRNSAMARYLNNPAKVTVKEDKVFVSIVVNNHSTVTGFQLEKDGKFVEPTDQKVDEKNNTRKVTYELDELGEVVKAQVQYKVGNYQGNQPLRLAFKEETVQKVQWVNLGEQVEVEAGKTVRIPNEDIAIAIPADLPLGTEMKVELKEENETPALEENLQVAGSVVEVTLLFPNGYENFQSKYTLTLPYDREIYKENADKIVDIYYFNESENKWRKLNGTVDTANGTVSVEVNHFSIYGVLANSSDTQEGNNDDGNNNDNNDNNNNNNYNDNNDNNNSNNGGNDNQTGDEQKVCINGEYSIPIEILKPNSNEKSVTNDYIKDQKGKLIVKDGKFKVQVTITNASWWQYFKVATKGGYQDVRVITEDSSKDERVVEFDVINPKEILSGKVHIIVTGIPGFQYDNKYDISIKFDVSGIDFGDCLDESSQNSFGDKTTGDNNGSNQQGDVSYKSTTGSSDKLTFDRDGDATSDKDTGKSGEANPKTADTAKITLFASLLIASLIPLLMKLRARFRVTNE